MSDVGGFFLVCVYSNIPSEGIWLHAHTHTQLRTSADQKQRVLTQMVFFFEGGRGDREKREREVGVDEEGAENSVALRVFRWHAALSSRSSHHKPLLKNRTLTPGKSSLT